MRCIGRRELLSAVASLASARALVAAATESLVRPPRPRIGICTFSCHQHWKAVQTGYQPVKFEDALGYYRYARALGAEGVQTPLRANPSLMARAIRGATEGDGGYYEGELRLPHEPRELPEFEEAVKWCLEAGATVARAVFTSGRRYETFKSPDEFRAFHARARRTLEMAEPVLRRHRLRLAVENHKDHTVEELLALMRGISSEWIGVLVDTGNNIALLEEPHAVVEKLAPFALSVHLKDMAVQSHHQGFLLSEVELGTGALDLPRMITNLARANPAIVLNLEMATRDPLLVPCLTEEYARTFDAGSGFSKQRDAMVEWVRANPPRRSPPSVSGKAVAQILNEEESHNRASLSWMRAHVPAAG